MSIQLYNRLIDLICLRTFDMYYRFQKGMQFYFGAFTHAYYIRAAFLCIFVSSVHVYTYSCIYYYTCVRRPHGARFESITRGWKRALKGISPRASQRHIYFLRQTKLAGDLVSRFDIGRRVVDSVVKSNARTIIGFRSTHCLDHSNHGGL